MAQGAGAASLIGKSAYSLGTPRLLLDLDIMERNIRGMAAFARTHGLLLRPHVKTHKIPELALLQVESGAVGVAVATLAEAEEMARAGIQDICLANEIVTEDKAIRLLQVSKRARVSCAVDSLAGARVLSTVFSREGAALPVLIDVDTGLHRCGVPPGEPALRLCEGLRSLPGLLIRGVMTHAGHAYRASGPEEVAKIGREEGLLMVETAALLREHGHLVDTVSVGSTPTVRHSGLVAGVTEIRPGNYIVHDANQVALGVARFSDCAATVLTTVISTPSPDRAIVDAGSKTLSSERGAHGGGTGGYGVVPGRDLTVYALSEEHGFLRVGRGELVKVGDRLRLVPAHACPVFNLLGEAVGVRNDIVEQVFAVTATSQAR